MGDDLRRQMTYERRRKSRGIAYLLWFFFGVFGVHRFYTGHTKSAVVQLVLLLTGIGVLVLLPWLLVDIFLIPGLVRERNLETMMDLGYQTPKAETPRPPQPQQEAPPQPRPVTSEADRRREAMLEDLRKTGYRKERPSFSEIYR